jgi:transposase
MIPLSSNVQVWLATGHTDMRMRKGFDGLVLLVQKTLKRNPHNGICSCSAAGAAG